MADMEFHEAAGIFPLDDEHIGALADDIRTNGQQVPIEIFDGKVLDGRRRWLACMIAQVEPLTREVEVDDPVAYVLSLNLHRRHLSPSQLSMVAARAREVYDKQAKERQRASGGSHKHKAVPENLPEPKRQDARDAAGKAVGVSGKSVDYATLVLKQGSPELVAAVDTGEIAVSTAARASALPADEQAEFVKSTKGRPGARSAGVRQDEPEHDEAQTGKIRGVGVRHANEAIDCLKRIPKDDALRKRGFQIVTDWIRRNK